MEQVLVWLVGSVEFGAAVRYLFVRVELRVEGSMGVVRIVG